MPFENPVYIESIVKSQKAFSGCGYMCLQPHFLGSRMRENNSFKAKLTVPEQIECMKENGIRFELFSEDRAAEFLAKRNYFFKVKAFAKNFDKWRLKDGSHCVRITASTLSLSALQDACLSYMIFRRFWSATTALCKPRESGATERKTCVPCSNGW